MYIPVVKLVFFFNIGIYIYNWRFRFVFINLQTNVIQLYLPTRMLGRCLSRYVLTMVFCLPFEGRSKDAVIKENNKSHVNHFYDSPA